MFFKVIILGRMSEGKKVRQRSCRVVLIVSRGVWSGRMVLDVEVRVFENIIDFFSLVKDLCQIVLLGLGFRLFFRFFRFGIFIIEQVNFKIRKRFFQIWEKLGFFEEILRLYGRRGFYRFMVLVFQFFLSSIVMMI